MLVLIKIYRGYVQNFKEVRNILNFTEKVNFFKKEKILVINITILKNIQLVLYLIKEKIFLGDEICIEDIVI